MYNLKILRVVLVLSTLPMATTAKQLTSPDEVVAKIVAQEQADRSNCEKMPFQIAHFFFYLTRQAGNSASEDPDAVATKLPGGSKPQAT
jgi:hypothetical protein